LPTKDFMKWGQAEKQESRPKNQAGPSEKLGGLPKKQDALGPDRPKNQAALSPKDGSDRPKNHDTVSLPSPAGNRPPVGGPPGSPINPASPPPFIDVAPAGLQRLQDAHNAIARKLGEQLYGAALALPEDIWTAAERAEIVSRDGGWRLVLKALKATSGARCATFSDDSTIPVCPAKSSPTITLDLMPWPPLSIDVTEGDWGLEPIDLGPAITTLTVHRRAAA
jgi:hypothetical protein